jgi:hypothetical protein
MFFYFQKNLVILKNLVEELLPFENISNEAIWDFSSFVKLRNLF